MLLELLEQFKDTIITAIISIATGTFAYFQGKRTKEAETKQAEGAALETIQSVYDKFASDTKSRLDEQHAEIIQMKEERIKEKEERASETKSLRDKIKSLMDRVAQLQLDLDDCRKNVE